MISEGEGRGQAAGGPGDGGKGSASRASADTDGVGVVLVARHPGPCILRQLIYGRSQCLRLGFFLDLLHRDTCIVQTVGAIPRVARMASFFAMLPRRSASC